MKVYNFLVEGDKSEIIQKSRSALVSKAANIKSIDVENGLIVCSFNYGINVNGLESKISFKPNGGNLWEIAVTAEFSNDADNFGSADKEASDLADLIKSNLTSTTHQKSFLNTNLDYALNQIKKTSIVSWVVIMLIALFLSAIPTGFGILLIPLIGLIGSLIGLPFSRWLAKRAHGVIVINRSDKRFSELFWLYDMVDDLAKRANIPTPEVGIYESDNMNAFASGSTVNSSVIAFSSELIDQLNKREIQAVAAHEIGHIISNDMRGMAIVSGLLTSFILVFTLPLQGLRILNLFGDNFSIVVDIIFWLCKLMISILLTFLGSLVIKMYSRKREYKADAIAAILVGKDAMISALNKLNNQTEEIPLSQQSYNTLKISNNGSWSEFFSTHPSIENRIRALQSELHSPL